MAQIRSEFGFLDDTFGATLYASGFLLQVTEEQKKAIGKFCDTLENANASELLFENIADFCEKSGIEKIISCYKDAKRPLPLSLASNLITIVGQVNFHQLHFRANNEPLLQCDTIL